MSPPPGLEPAGLPAFFPPPVPLAAMRIFSPSACTLLPMLMPTLATTAIATPASTSPNPPSALLPSLPQPSVTLPEQIGRAHV